jgi:hypothetical protein
LNTFRELYCDARRCRREEFVAHVFWRCLERPAVPLALFVGLLRPGYFAADRELILAAGRARTLREINEELADFARDPRNRGFGRGLLRLRVSADRLRRLARAQLPTAWPAGPGPLPDRAGADRRDASAGRHRGAPGSVVT